MPTDKSDYSDPAEYWQQRLEERFDLRGVGFGTLGPRFNAALYRARARSLQRALASTGGTLAGLDVCEIGCGTGFYAEQCRDHGASSYTGVDIAAVSVERLRARFPAYTFVKADITAPEAAVRGTFDLVLMADMLFHIVDDARFRIALRNAAAMVRPGGRLILSDVLGERSFRAAEHVWHRSEREYATLLSASGLRLDHREPIFAVLHPPSLMPGTSLAWRAYTRLWRHGLLRLAGLDAFDRTAPTLLAWLDEHLFLRHAGPRLPNTSWLVARRG